MVGAVVGQRVDVGGQQRDHRPDPHLGRDLRDRRSHIDRAAAWAHGRRSERHRAVVRHAHRGPQVDPLARRQVHRPVRGPLSEHRGHQQIGAEQVLVVETGGDGVLRISERELPHQGHARGLIGVVAARQVRVQPGAQLRVPLPDRRDRRVGDLGARRAEVDAARLQPHHPGERAELDPAVQQLGREAVVRPGEEAADVAAPHRDAREPHAQPLAHRRLQPVEAPQRRGVAAPDDVGRRDRAGPARPVEPGEWLVCSVGVGLRGGVVADDVAVVKGAAGAGVGGDRGVGGVLAEVLHPAVIAVTLGDLQDAVEHPAARRRGEVDLRHDEVRRGRVVVDQRRPVRVLRERRRLKRCRIDRVAQAHHGVHVGGDGDTGGVQGARASLLVGRDLSPAGQVVGVGLRHRDRDPVGALHGQLGGGVEIADRLPPGSQDERRPGGVLPSDRGGHAAQRVGRRRAGEDPQVQVRGGHLGAPAVGMIRGGERESGLGLVVEEYPAATGRQHPGHREVRGVGPQIPSRRRHVGLNGRLLGRVRPVEHTVEHVVAALVDRVRTLASAEEAIRGRRREVDRHTADAVTVPSRGERVRPVSAARGGDVNRDTRLVGRHGRSDGAAATRRRDHSGGSGTSLRGHDTQTGTVGLKHRGSVTVDQTHRPWLTRRHGELHPQLRHGVRVSDRGCRGRHWCAERAQRGGGGHTGRAAQQCPASEPGG